MHDVANSRGEEDPVHHVDEAALVLGGYVSLEDVSAVDGDHLDVLPISVLGAIHIGPELGARDTWAHEIVSEVLGPDKSPDQMILDDPL